MNSVFTGIATLTLAFMPQYANADQITLNLAFITSDQSTAYRAMVQPLVEAINAEGKGVIEIVVHPAGILAGRDMAQQPQAVLEGVADIAFIVPGYTPAMFPDTSVLELPGLFEDLREGTLVYTRMIARNALKGYGGFVVLGAYVEEPAIFHSRLPINTIADLEGQRIRVNNATEGNVLEKLGAVPERLSLNQVTAAISNGDLDGVTLPSTVIADFGIMRLTSHHYLLRVSAAPLALVMSRTRFEALPVAAQNLLSKYSGEWAAEHYIETLDRADVQVMQQLESEPARMVVRPSPVDLAQAQRVFQSVIQDWLKADPAHQALLDVAQDEIALTQAER